MPIEAQRPELLCFAHVLGNAAGKRVALVKWYEMGYYPTNYDLPNWTSDDVDLFVRESNDRLGVPPDVAESALDGSMFGWHVPAADKAIEFYKTEKQYSIPCSLLTTRFQNNFSSLILKKD